jgi:protein-L-isoaspartate(D-aspartate) O-methyltransferase
MVSVCCLSLAAAVVLWGETALPLKGVGKCHTRDYAKERERMVREQIQARGIKDHLVLEAMRRVARHCFVPRGLEAKAYQDHPLPIGSGQTISQPYVVAMMTDLLRLKPTDRVLEIGTGSGYQAAVLSRLANRVFSVEIHPPLAEEAKSRLRDLGYKNIEVKTGDGYFGWKEHAPFDAIIVTAAPGEIPPPLLQQLKPGGRMCIPVGAENRIQELMLIEKSEDGSIRKQSLLPVRFVPLLGKH